MKKILKKEVIIAFLIGILLASGIVYAATSANQVTYTRTGTSVNTVEEALNDLYNKSNKSLTVEYIIGGHSAGTSNHQTRISNSGYRDNYKYFKITLAEPYTSTHSVNLQISDNYDDKGSVLNVNSEYLTSEHSMINVSSTATVNSFYKLNITYYN